MEFENLDLKFKTLKYNIETLRSSRNPYLILANYRNMPLGSDSCTPYPTVHRNMPPNDVIEQCLIVQACSFLYTHLTAVEVRNAHRTMQLHCNTNERPTPLQDSEFPVHGMNDTCSNHNRRYLLCLILSGTNNTEWHAQLLSPKGLRTTSSWGFLNLMVPACVELWTPSAGSEYWNSPKGPASTEHSVNPGQFRDSEPGSKAFPKLPIYSNIRHIKS
jgi:hypothetical protein